MAYLSSFSAYISVLIFTFTYIYMLKDRWITVGPWNPLSQEVRDRLNQAIEVNKQASVEAFTVLLKSHTPDDIRTFDVLVTRWLFDVLNVHLERDRKDLLSFDDFYDYLEANHMQDWTIDYETYYARIKESAIYREILDETKKEMNTLFSAILNFF